MVGPHFKIRNHIILKFNKSLIVSKQVLTRFKWKDVEISFNSRKTITINYDEFFVIFIKIIIWNKIYNIGMINKELD